MIEDLRAESRQLAERTNTKAFCKYSGQISLIPLNAVELYYLQQLSVRPSAPFALTGWVRKEQGGCLVIKLNMSHTL